jgi:pilus assembly protein CpaE
MDALVASDEARVAEKVRTCLAGLGIRCRSLDGLSIASLRSALASVDRSAPPILFFCSSRFGADDVAVLKQFCAADNRPVVIGVGPVGNPHIVLEAVRCGAFDYLDPSDDERFCPTLTAVIHRIAARRDGVASTGRLFSVLSPAGGCGASFLTCNIAAALARDEGVCGLLDLHLRGGDLERLLNITPRYTIASLAGKASNLDAALLDQALHKHECGIHLLAAPELFSDYRQITRELVQRIVQLARHSLPNTVVDLEDAEHAEQLRTLAESDRIVMPVRPDYVSLVRARKYLDFLAKAKVSESQIVLVANRTGQPREMPLRCMEDLVGMPVRHRIPNDPTTANTAYNLGVPVVVSQPNSPLAQSICELVRSLTGRAAAAPAATVPTPAARLRRWSQELVHSLFPRRSSPHPDGGAAR